jgi:flavin reductase (DIM6/NTAB) family NADH-FMN oxidoreductase RutF
MAPALKLMTDSMSRREPGSDFTDAMSTLAGGVVLVTSWVDARPWGTTVIAFASVSADPPTVLVSLRSDGISAREIAVSRRFGISMLSARQVSVARFGSAAGRPKFLEAFVDPDDRVSVTPVVAGALAHLDCEVTETVPIADHIVFFGRVRMAHASGGTPLVYHGRDYRTLVEPDPVRRTERSVPCLSI